MFVEKPSLKAAVSISEIAEMCRLSRSRFYGLVNAGVFPNPVQTKSSKRPIYDQQLQQKCLDIRRTCIGLNGDPILFNRKSKKDRPAKVAPKPEHADLLDALSELGLKTTSEAITASLAKLFPKGVEKLDPGIVLKKLFQDQSPALNIKPNKRKK